MMFHVVLPSNPCKCEMGGIFLAYIFGLRNKLAFAIRYGREKTNHESFVEVGSQ